MSLRGCIFQRTFRPVWGRGGGEGAVFAPCVRTLRNPLPTRLLVLSPHLLDLSGNMNKNKFSTILKWKL